MLPISCVIIAHNEAESLKCCLNPASNFMNRYVLRGGFLDKFPGFYYAILTSFYTFLKYLLAIELRLKRNE